MLTVAEAFDKFKSRLEITEREEKSASRRHNDIRQALVDALGAWVRNTRGGVLR